MCTCQGLFWQYNNPKVEARRFGRVTSWSHPTSKTNKQIAILVYTYKTDAAQIIEDVSIEAFIAPQLSLHVLLVAQFCSVEVIS